MAAAMTRAPKPVLCLQAVDQRLRGLKQGHEDGIRHVTGLGRS